MKWMPMQMVRMEKRKIRIFLKLYPYNQEITIQER